MRDTGAGETPRRARARARAWAWACSARKAAVAGSSCGGEIRCADADPAAPRRRSQQPLATAGGQAARQAAGRALCVVAGGFFGGGRLANGHGSQHSTHCTLRWTTHGAVTPSELPASAQQGGCSVRCPVQCSSAHNVHDAPSRPARPSTPQHTQAPLLSTRDSRASGRPSLAFHQPSAPSVGPVKIRFCALLPTRRGSVDRACY